MKLAEKLKRLNKSSTGDFDPSVITTEVDSNNPIVQSAFYKFQAKHLKKMELSSLKAGFEEDKKRIAKI
jgi:hypothetical protein